MNENKENPSPILNREAIQSVMPTPENEDFKAAYDKIVQLDKVVDLQGLAMHSVVVVKLGGTESHRIRMHQAFMKFLVSKNEIFKQRKLTVLFLDNTDDFSTLSEEEMNKAGWFKKEKSLIVAPR